MLNIVKILIVVLTLVPVSLNLCEALSALDSIKTKYFIRDNAVVIH